MKWQLLLAFVGTAIALEPIGEPELVDGVWCYTYLSSYVVAVGAETTEGAIPIAPALPSTQRGILPTYFTNRSTSVFPSTFQGIVEPSSILESALDSLTEVSEIASESTIAIDSSFSSALPIPTDEEELEPTVTESTIATQTSAEVSATSSEAVSGQNVIFLISPRVSNERRGLEKRAKGGFVGNGNTSNVRICTNAATFTLAGGQLLDDGKPVYYNGESFKELIGQEDPPDGAITRDFASVAGNLVFANTALPDGEAEFCQDPDSGQVFMIFGSNPSGCIPIILRAYQVEQCQNGRIIGLEMSSSASIESTRVSLIPDSTTTVLPSSVSELSSSIDVGGTSVSTALSLSTVSSSTTITTIHSFDNVVSTATLDSSSIEPSFYLPTSSSVASTEPIESSLSSTLSEGSSIDTETIDSTFSVELPSSLDASSTYLLSASTTDIASTETLSTESPTAEPSTTEVSTEPTAPFPSYSTSTSAEISTTEAETTTAEPTTTTADMTTTTSCDSITPLTTVVLASPTPVFDDGLDHNNDYFEVSLPWAPNRSSGTTIIVSINGVLSIPSDNGASGAAGNEPLKSSIIPPWSLLPYWDDFYLDRTKDHTIVYEVFQGLYGRQVNFEWVIGKRNEEGIFHFEAILFEDYPDDMEFHYYTIPDSGGSATVGWQKPINSGSFVQYSFDEAGKVTAGLKLNLHTSHRQVWPSGFDNTECGKGADRQ
ncbi:hypothetical protein FVEN_g803 [Fusarium venenatum]|uniref:DUF7908 domain-containing protein n=1 Tax=Fusarium venenatum TaxID=56646 RepID=A0A2L2TQ48_9HYPO|nr:uncharacterized protein FVRRES_10790 [Fusarium venenatum]KAG8361360.1 hypothetical protein FVEN_g803 [Fusarium venenatum]KAH6967367.1 hypothetical protein EDB82DRAFT_481651 [Fusarium venenatum]CEI70713.1 unnamed protein product [Fusarium venenatum]